MARKHVPDHLVCMAYFYCNHVKCRIHVGGITLLPFPEELLCIWTKQPQKVCYRAMERAHRRGMIEYGVSLRTGWLTDLGRAAIGVPSRQPNEREGGMAIWAYA